MSHDQKSIHLRDMHGLTVQGPVEWTEEEKAEIAAIVAKYPTQRSAIMPVLWTAQRTWGWLQFEVLKLVAATLSLKPSEVMEVATFYTMFKKEPTGKYLIQACHTLSCALLGADRVIRHIETKLQLDEHGNSPDGKFTLMRVECLASCGSGPMMQVNEHFHERLTPQIVDEVVAALRSGRPLATPRPEVDRWTFPVS